MLPQLVDTLTPGGSVKGSLLEQGLGMLKGLQG
jgi:hypothetical protein